MAQRRCDGVDAAAAVIAVGTFPLTVLVGQRHRRGEDAAAVAVGAIASNRAVLKGEYVPLPKTTRPPPAVPATLRATVVRTSVTFPVPSLLFETPPPNVEARFSVIAQSRTTRSALPTRMPPPPSDHFP